MSEVAGAMVHDFAGQATRAMPAGWVQEGGLGKVLLTPREGTALWAQPLMLPLEKERGGGGSQQMNLKSPSPEMKEHIYCAGERAGIRAVTEGWSMAGPAEVSWPYVGSLGLMLQAGAPLSAW